MWRRMMRCLASLGMDTATLTCVKGMLRVRYGCLEYAAYSTDSCLGIFIRSLSSNSDFIFCSNLNRRFTRPAAGDAQVRRLICSSFLDSCSEQGLANTRGEGRQLSFGAPNCGNLRSLTINRPQLHIRSYILAPNPTIPTWRIHCSLIY